MMKDTISLFIRNSLFDIHYFRVIQDVTAAPMCTLLNTLHQVSFSNFESVLANQPEKGVASSMLKLRSAS